MTLRCKPGDLAYVVNTRSDLAGRVVEVISAAPIGVRFRLPDGYLQEAQSYEWIARSPTAVRAPLNTGGFRLAHYGCVPERCLKPISRVPMGNEVSVEAVA